MLRKIGCRLHDYGQGSIDELSVMASRDGYKTIQLAPMKVDNQLSVHEDFLREDYANECKKNLEAHGLDVSVLGAYVNYATPDDAMRDKHIERLKKHLALGNAFGCRMVGTETGSLDEKYKDHIDNHGDEAFERFAQAIKMVMPVAQENNMIMAVEAVSNHIIHTPKRMKRLIEEVNHPLLKVIFDITNIMTPENLDQQDDLINEMFDLLEDDIIVAHVKDFRFVDGKKEIVKVGEGLVHLELLFKRIHESKSQIDVLAENIARDELKNMYAYVNDYFK